jgi:cyclomaltodextrinase / maltogenic alpha-amylase / neopullulanase
MDYSSVYHEAKSAMAYAFDGTTIHLRLKAKKGLLKSVEVIAGDPFQYNQKGWVKFAELTMNLEATTALHDVYFARFTPPYKRMKYAFILDGSYLFGTSEIIDLNQHPELKYNLFNYFNFPYLLDADRFIAPAWAKNQVWISIFPSRFHRHQEAPFDPSLKAWTNIEDLSNQDKYGGTLRGITEKLDYLYDVGFTAIYLTPIFEASSQHKYDTTDYYAIDPEFGTLDDFKELVEKAHEKGIRIVLDLVFNHIGAFHPWFQDVLEKGNQSPYQDYFFIKDLSKPLLPFTLDELKDLPYALLKDKLTPQTLNYETFGFTPFMPKVNTDHPEVSAYFIEVALFWLKETKVDGFRLDVSNEVSHRFWREFRSTLKKVDPEVYIVGENWDISNPWLRGDQYDAVMNYGLLFPLWQTFGKVKNMPKLSVLEFVNRINQLITTYPKPVLEAMYNLVDSHDTARLLTITEGNLSKFKQAYLFMFAFPGSPSLFYGDEIGVDGEHDPKNRRPMPWSAMDFDLLSWFKALIHLRKTHPALRSSEGRLHHEGDLIIYVKDDALLLVLNTGRDQAIDLAKYGFKGAHVLFESLSIGRIEKDGYKLYKK